MEVVREIAMAWYERLPQDEKDTVKCNFDGMDVNGDGYVSFTEFKKLDPNEDDIESTFKAIDLNGDGKVDFGEFVTITYIVIKECKQPFCDGCSRSLLGIPFFSCLLCLGKGPASYDLCCGCYRGGKSDGHEHSVEFLKDPYALLQDYWDLLHAQDQTSKNVVSNNAHGAIEELRAIAKSYYEAGSAEVKTLAYEFFKALDTDNDNTVHLEEFLTFMKREGYVQMRRLSFFHELDKNGDGKLDFWEVMTLYYIIKSGRPFCDECEKFIPGVYFSCLECHLDGVGSSFTLCIHCYGCPSARRNHTHKGPAQFVDNYTLLNVTKRSAHATTTMVNQHEQRSCPPGSSPFVHQTINYNNCYNTTYNSHNNTSNSTAIVPAAKSRNFSRAEATFLALEAACVLGKAAIAASLCTIM